MKSIKIIALLSAFALSACVTTPPPLTREEYLSATTRDYQGVSREQVIGAAEEVLRLDGGDDVKFSDSQTGFVATRNWADYLVLTDLFGTDTWVANTENLPNGTRIMMQVGSTTSNLVPLMSSGGDVFVTSTAPIANPVPGNAIYDVFWARLDYMLGKRGDWMTCDEANARVDQKITWGPNDPMCNSFNVKDRTPQGPMVSAR